VISIRQPLESPKVHRFFPLPGTHDHAQRACFKPYLLGHAEQWGAVARKKEKKPIGSVHGGKDGFAGRGDSRGARGGRGGRGGGPARGGASTRGGRGAGRGGHRDTNGHAAPAHTNGGDAAPAAWGTETPSDWNNVAGTDDKADKAEAPKEDLGAWGTDTSTVADTTPSVTSPSTTATASAPLPDVSEIAKASTGPKVHRTPLTSKMSWAQIAKSALSLYALVVIVTHHLVSQTGP
jgi:hypothetical protein